MPRIIVLGLMIALWGQACVKPKIYKAEQTLRVKSEARETVLVKELVDRKAETAKLTELVANLNRTLGNQESEITALRTELASRTQQMGESSSKLFTEKTALEKELADKKNELKQRNGIIQRVWDAQDKRKGTLKTLQNVLIKGYGSIVSATVALDGETILLTLDDKALFEPAGLNISAAGKTLLNPVATVLTERPDLDIDIVCYTDNVLPKGNKTLTDTWDWSLQRATAVTRLLIREFNISANQLTPIGRGEFYPVTSNETPEGRQKNRRTVIVIRPAFPAIPPAE